MYMYHCRYDYYCVIYGWDYTCEMTEAWIHQMGVNQLPLGPSQPFYNVLVLMLRRKFELIPTQIFR